MLIPIAIKPKLGTVAYRLPKRSMRKPAGPKSDMSSTADAVMIVPTSSASRPITSIP